MTSHCSISFEKWTPYYKVFPTDSFSYGTNQFSVYVSLKPDSEWSKVLTSNLPNAKDVTCENIPLMVYDIQRTGRYVKVTMHSFYDNGAGLQYVGIDFEEACGKC